MDNTPFNDKSPDLWSRFETKRRSTRFSPSSARQNPKFDWVLGAAVPFAVMVAAGLLISFPADLRMEARVALFCFVLATILWSLTKLNAAFVALACALLLVVAGGAKQEALFSSLASDVIWLMIGAFVLGGAVQKSGLAQRLTSAVVASPDGKPRSVGRICWLITFLLLPLSCLIPSTSGRGAVVLPLFKSVASAAQNPKITRALALLIPSIILVSTCSTLIGAGSHLIANDLLENIAKERISFAQWALWGVPFGVVASAITCAAIQVLFLSPQNRALEIRVPDVEQQRRKPLSRDENFVLCVAGAMIVLWLSESWHGFEIATVTIAGALILMVPRWGVLSWKEGLKAVSWNLILFVGAALVLGRALIETGAAKWIINTLFALLGIDVNDSTLVLLLALSFLTLTSHIYMTSHAARAAALIPALLYLAQSLEISPVAVAFIATVGMDYCLTFPVSSKALLMFQDLDGPTFEPGDLLKLSALLIPVHLVLMVLFYFGYWQFVGLKL